MELEIEGYGGKVQELVTESQTLLNREHFDQKMIQKKQVSAISIIIIMHITHENIYEASFFENEISAEYIFSKSNNSIISLDIN